ncbi:thioredoxin family protein [Sporosalibacterium faouarense]|uniref:thioredoxin family protein n=1 Tax=Sporosalibacterium faouarense TaxID=516123 RepID=UPI00141C7E87|nr:thioredoxin family protein [Sporosalibacterium faouarense]MTI48417.1 thioredoxin family protein [Bacillota bacterium]
MDINGLFKTGVSFDEFVNQDTDAYKEKTLQILDKIDFTEEEEEKIKSIDENINVLICAEMWCPDCMINVPVIEKMRLLNDFINISIVEKEGNEEFFKKYSPEENVKIPTFVFYDSEFNEIGSIVEHPRQVKQILSENNQPKRIVAMRKYRKGEYASYTLNDVLEIIL